MNDITKWSVVGIITVLGLVGQYIYSEMPVTQLVLGWVGLGIILLAVVVMTSQGQAFIGFAKEANVELRKVVWPTRQEAVQTTFIVLGVILLMGIVLWFMDSVLLHVVGIITGQKG